VAVVGFGPEPEQESVTRKSSAQGLWPQGVVGILTLARGAGRIVWARIFVVATDGKTVSRFRQSRVAATSGASSTKVRSKDLGKLFKISPRAGL